MIALTNEPESIGCDVVVTPNWYVIMTQWYINIGLFIVYTEDAGDSNLHNIIIPNKPPFVSPVKKTFMDMESSLLQRGSTLIRNRELPASQGRYLRWRFSWEVWLVSILIPTSETDVSHQPLDGTIYKNKQKVYHEWRIFMMANNTVLVQTF